MLIYKNYLSNNMNNDNNSNLFKRKMKKIMTLGLGNKPYKNKNIRNSPNKKSKQLISFFDYKDINNNINKINNSPSPKHSAGKYIQNKKRTNSFNTPNLQLKKLLSHNKIYIFNYREISKRSIKMIRRKSQGDSDIYNNNQKILLIIVSYLVLKIQQLI